MSRFHPSAKRMQKHIARGPIARTLLILGWPLMLTNASQMLYSIINMFWLGHYVGTVGIAATSLSWPLVFFLVSLSSGMSIAGTALVSQYAGMKDLEQVKRSAGQVMSLLLLISVGLSLLGILITDPLLGLMGAPGEVVVRASPYIKVIFSSIPFMFTIMTFAAILRGWGDTMTPMLISLVSLGINLALDPLLIIGIGPFPAWGVTGAAVATLISRSIAAAVCVHMLFRGRKNLRIKFRHMKLEMEKVRQIFRIGIPASLGQSFVALGFVILMSFVSVFGTAGLATYGVGSRVINMVFIITGGVTGAAVTMIGQNLGAGRRKRAARVLRTSVTITTLFLLTCSTLFFVFNHQLFGIFTDDPDVISEGRNFMLAFGFSIMGFGIFSSVQAAYQASGRTVPSMIMGMIRLWGLRLPLAYLFAFVLGWGIMGLWVGMGLSNYLSALMALAWASTGSWKRAVVKRKAPIPGGGVNGA